MSFIETMTMTHEISLYNFCLGFEMVKVINIDFVNMTMQGHSRVTCLTLYTQMVKQCLAC